MATTSDQLTTEIDRTRAKMGFKLDSVEQQAGGASGILDQVTDFVRERPLAAFGLSLVAGSLLQEFLSARAADGAGASTSVTSGADTATAGARGAVGTATDAARGAADTATGAATRAVDTATDAARSATQTTTGAARGAMESTTRVAQSVADTTTDVAQSAMQTAGRAVDQVADTAGDVATQAGDVASNLSTTMSDLASTVTEQIRQRPLAALGLAVGAGALAQPALAPQLAQVTRGVQQQVRQLGDSFSLSSGQEQPLANQQELDRVRRALVPATVERAKQFAVRDIRDFLDQNLQPVIGQTSLRAGIVAAVAERAEQFAESRLPRVLEANLQGTRALLLTNLIARVLKARNDAQQGQGTVIGLIRKDLLQAGTQVPVDDLKRFFPEFRQRYEQAAR